jgi:hypothetical protein
MPDYRALAQALDPYAMDTGGITPDTLKALQTINKSPNLLGMIADIGRGGLSNLESLVRGGVAQVPGTAGDLETLGRMGINTSFGAGGVKVSPKAVMPTTTDILGMLPQRVTQARPETAGMEELGTVMGPGLAKGVAPAVKGGGNLLGMAMNERLLAGQPILPSLAKEPQSAMFVVEPTKGAQKYPQEQALKLAQERAALPVSEGGLGLPKDNTLEMRAEAMNAIDYLHGTERMDRLLAGKTFDPRKATSGPMPFGTNTPPMASNYAMNKADTSLALNNFGNLEDYFQVLPKSMGQRGTVPRNVENVWYTLSPKKKSEILDKASRIGYEIPEEAGGGFVLHKTSEGMPYSKSHWEHVLNRESQGNPLTALRKTFAESGMLDAYAPSELADIYKLVGFPYEITQTNAPWTSAKGVFTGKALINNPINTSDTTTLQETVIPFLKEQFKNDRTRVKTGGVDQWDKNTRYTPKQWVDQLEEDLSKGENSFVWTSIPDKVTKQLEQLGFNGILDTGGKMGGEAHQVVIPFRPDQIRSRNAAFDPFRKDVATATAMGVALPDLLAAEAEDKKKQLSKVLTK